MDAGRAAGQQVRGLERGVRDAEVLDRVRIVLAGGAKTPFEIVPALVGTDDITPMLLNWGLNETLCYLRYLELRDEVEKVDAEPERWAAAA